MNNKPRKTNHPRRLWRVTAAAVGMLSLCHLLTLPTAATATYKPSDVYRDSVYYEELSAYELTGDMRRDVVSIAYTQLGYHEGNDPTQMDGSNLFGSRNYTEYNRIWSPLDNGEGNGESYGFAWCAAFVSWCLRQSGVPTAIAASEVSCARMMAWYRDHATYHPRGGYTPIAGDIIMFRYGSSAANHVGFVVGVDNGRVYTIEGNTSGEVGLRSYLLGNSTILGYCVPDYAVEQGAVYDFPLTEQYTTGEYVTLAASLNVRTGPSTAHARLGKLPAGMWVDVREVRGEWGRITYGGREAWICLNYAGRNTR